MTPVDVSFPLQGLIAEGEGLVLGWPELTELDTITKLRNRASVRRWFADSRTLDLAANRKWLAEGMNRSVEGLLAIRTIDGGHFLGTVGWTNYDKTLRSACFGRLMIDTERVLKIREQGLWAGGSIAVIASIILRDYCFGVLQFSEATTWYFKSNRLAAKVNSAIGMTVHRLGIRGGPDGRPEHTVELVMSQEMWRKLTGAL